MHHIMKPEDFEVDAERFDLLSIEDHYFEENIVRSGNLPSMRRLRVDLIALGFAFCSVTQIKSLNMAECKALVGFGFALPLLQHRSGMFLGSAV